MTKRLDYNQIAPNAAKALGGVYGYVMQSGLLAELVELVYLRVAQINNCTYAWTCILGNGSAIERMEGVRGEHGSVHHVDRGQ